MTIAAVLGVLFAVVIVISVIAFACFLIQGVREATAPARAFRALNREHRRARRAMNDAAGQSWRNLIE
jgi:hypothetical protein